MLDAAALPESRGEVYRREAPRAQGQHVQAAAISQLHVEHECIALHGRQFIDRVLFRSTGANDLDTRKSTQRLDEQVAQEGGVFHQLDLEWMSRYHGTNVNHEAQLPVSASAPIC